MIKFFLSSLYIALVPPFIAVKFPPDTAIFTLAMFSTLFFCGLLSYSALKPFISPLIIFTSIGKPVVCCAIAIPAPSVVEPLPLGVTVLGALVPVISVFSDTVSSPARISIPVAPVIFAPSIFHFAYPAA